VSRIAVEPVTLWHVAQCLNQLCHHVPTVNVYPVQNAARHSISRMRMGSSFRNVRNNFRDVVAMPHCINHFKQVALWRKLDPVIGVQSR
jgi:hypothetical protein